MLNIKGHIFFALIKLNQNRNKTYNNNNEKENDIDSIIRKNHITCTRYYRHRMNDMKKLLTNDPTLLGHVNDFFFVIEFHNRGNKHDHALIWIKNALIYVKSSNCEVIQFIDKYITCNTNLIHQKFANMHWHHHWIFYREYSKTQCKYNFPISPMKRTRILELIIVPKQIIINNFTKVCNAIKQEQYNESVSFDSFLEKLSMIERDYIKDIQSTLKTIIIFLKRKPSHTWNNSFTIKIPDL